MWTKNPGNGDFVVEKKSRNGDFFFERKVEIEIFLRNKTWEWKFLGKTTRNVDFGVVLGWFWGCVSFPRDFLECFFP